MEYAPVELERESVPSLLRKYSVPAIIAMTAASLYNMVDSIYIGQGFGALAISGLSVTFPLMNISTAVGTLFGVGAATLISILLGEKNYALARKTLGNMVLLSLVSGLLFQVAFLVFLDPILMFFGASEATIPYAREYMRIILYGTVVTFMYYGLNNILRTSGRPKQAMLVTLLTVTLNIILDPVFMFVFKMGVRGAAVATLVCQVISLVWICALLLNKGNVMHLSRGIFRFDWKITGRICSIGMAPFLMNTASCFVVMFVNRQLFRYGGDLAIGAFGICNKILFFFIMITMGFTQGMQPIVSYNFGAKLHKRVTQALNRTLLYGTLTTTVAFLIGELIPSAAVRLFTSDPELIDKSVVALRIMAISMPLVGYEIVVGNFFQCIGKAGKAIFISLSRQLTFLLPLLFVFPLFWGLEGVWWSMPVSDAISFAIALAMLLAQRRSFEKTTESVTVFAH